MEPRTPRVAPSQRPRIAWRRLLWGALCLGGLLTARPAQAELMCTLFNHCVYEAAAFSIRVVDKETGEPLADVHAVAAWVRKTYGPGGEAPFMVQDAVSSPDGVLAFPAWGPMEGHRLGLVLYKDPAITLFKPGYLLSRPREGAPRVIQNHSPYRDETTRVRRFGQDGKTFTMERFRGTPEEWLKELNDDLTGSLAYSGNPAQDGPYFNRLRRVLAEREKYPARYQAPGQFFWHVERSLKALEGDRQ